MEEHRSSPRYNLSSVAATLGDKECEVVDVSPTGIFLKGADPSLERGDVVSVDLTVPLMSKVVPVRVDGFVVRSDEKGVAVDYAKPATTWPHVLRILDVKENRSG